MSDHIPEEIILIEILLKLPVKSLIRFTSVCKQWRSLIRSPYFISSHLSNTENQALVRRYDIKERQEHYKVIPKRGPFVINSDSSEFDFPFKCRWYFIIVGSSDGLVCLSDWLRIIIWNPAIRNHVVLPRPQLVNLNQSHHTVFGFGVANNVYKVVRIVLGRNPNGNGFIVPPQAEIFCLGTGMWRELSGFDVKGLVPLYPGRPIFFEGLVHWISYNPISDNSVGSSILTFHVGDEVFGETMLPQELERVALVRSLSLAVMGESLGAIKYDMMGNERCDVWMMKDYGVKESWTRLYRIDFRGFKRVIGFWGSSEALVVVGGQELATYNPETNGIRHVGVLAYTSLFYVNDYKESLVLLGGYSGDSGEGLN